MKTLSFDEQIMPQKKYPWTLLLKQIKVIALIILQIFFAESCTRVKNNRSVGHRFTSKHVDALDCYNSKTLFHLEVEVFKTCV